MSMRQRKEPNSKGIKALQHRGLLLPEQHGHWGRPEHRARGGVGLGGHLACMQAPGPGSMPRALEEEPGRAGYRGRRGSAACQWDDLTVGGEGSQPGACPMKAPLPRVAA